LGGAGVIAAGLVGAADVASDGQLNGEFRGCAPALSPPIFGENTRVRENVWEMEPIYQATPEPEPAPEPAPAPGRVPVPVQTQTPEPTRRLYHGTATTAVSQLLANIDLRTGNPNVDFGQGFYRTQSLRHAEERALQKGGPGNASVIVYDVPKYELLASSHLVFHSPSRAWTSFVLE